MGPIKVLCASVVILSAGGCSAGNSISAWQASLEQYIVEQGNGDPNALRNVQDGPCGKQFGLIGAREQGIPFVAPVRTDVTGVLLGHRTINGHNWYIFLIGAVEYRGAFVDFPLDDPHVSDVRVIAFSGQGGEFRWLVGDEDRAAVAGYCQPQLEAWRRSHPSRAAATEAPTDFPTSKDIFRLTVAPDVVTVIDEHSSARWTLVIPTPSGLGNILVFSEK